MENLVNNFKYTLKRQPEAYNYLLSRGMNDYTLDYYNLGYCKQKLTGFEVLYKRIVFPIYNWQNECISFASRSIDKGIKYLVLNRPGFEKSKNVYGLNIAMPHIAKSRVCFIVEGFTDVIGMQMSGLYNTVSSMGVAATKYQAQLIARWAKTIVVIFDGDKAGQRAKDNVISKLKEADLGVRLGYVLLSGGVDPYDLYLKYKSELWDSFLKSKIYF